MDTLTLLQEAAPALSLVSLGVSGMAYLNSRQGRLDTKEAALFKLRLDTLKGAKECECLWQDFINDMYHQIQKYERRPSSEPRLAAAKEMALQGFKEAHAGFTPALEHAKDVCQRIEANFDTFSKKDCEKWLRLFELGKIGLTQSRAESIRKYALIESTFSSAATSNVLS